MNNVSIERLTDYGCKTGANRVYWTDISNGKLYRYDLATGPQGYFFCGTMRTPHVPEHVSRVRIAR